jgi:dethiobiotin synthetase
MTRTLFITATGTGVGKTWVTRGLAAALRARGRAVVAVKPYETGCDPDPRDALAIARAAGEPDPARIALHPGLYRARSPLAPYAATLGGEPPPAPLDALAARTRELGGGADVLLVEGAGGLLVPVDETHDLADFARALDAPLLLVAKDGLGVLSHVLTASAAARERGLAVAAIALTAHDTAGAPSRAHNARILTERTRIPVVRLRPSRDDDDALRHAIDESALLDRLGLAV